jgi:hypothetical protein
MHRPRPSDSPITWKRALGWLALVTGLLAGADLAERFLLYDLAKKDVGSLARFARRPVKDTALALLHALPRDIEVPAADAGESVPVFDFYFKPEDEALLRAHISRVQLLSTHDELTKEEVPARLSVAGQDFDAFVKLRGRQYYHVVPPRPSLRVDLRHGRSYRGSTLFNLIDPFDKTGDQAFLWESIEHDLIGWDTTMGILALRGEPVAVVQYVEQPRIETGDRAGRPEGMFFRGSGEPYSQGADPVRCGKVVERVVRWLGDTTGTISWEELRELFDVERLRWFTALTEFGGDGHGFADFNMKGFCDPVTLKAEMMIWDTRFGDWSKVATSQFAEMGTQLLRCDRFRLLHDQALYVLASERLAPMLARADEFFARYGALLAEDPFHSFPRGGPDGGFMGDRSAKLRATLEKNARDISAALTGTHLLWHLERAARTLELATGDRGPKELVALELQDGGRVVRFALPEPVEIPGRYRARQPVRVVTLPADVAAEAVRGVVARNLCGGAEVHGLESAQALTGERVSWTSHPPRAALPELPAGASADDAAALVRFGPGPVELAAPLSLPRGWRVRFEPGTELALGPAVYVEIRGDLTMAGSADAPVLVRRAGAEPWGAFAVLGERGAPLTVTLTHTTFRGGAGSNAGAVRCTGSVALYFTELAMDHVTVEQNTSEDAINPKFSRVHNVDCQYRDGASDAVDYDFCTGLDVRTRVERFGNDGIDVSGSRLRVEGAVIRDVGDKGLSVGEASRPEYVDVTVIGPHTGVAIKDKSDARFERLTIVRADIAVALYVKKESFGPSRAEFRDLRVLDTPAMAVLDAGCEATFENARRVGANADEMRPFAGVRNEVVPDIWALELAQLLELALR